MRRISAAAMAALLIALALALTLTGCSSWLESPAKPANDAITTANDHLKKAVKAGTSVSDAAARLESIPYTTAGAAEALKLTAEIKADLTSQKAELEAAKAAMDSIVKLDVAEEFKAYARLESTALQTRAQVVDLGTKLYTEMDKLYTILRKGKSRVPDTQGILDGIDMIRRDMTAVSELAAQQATAAADYFTAHKLGG